MYQYIIGPVRTVRTEWYHSKLHTMVLSMPSYFHSFISLIGGNRMRGSVSQNGRCLSSGLDWIDRFDMLLPFPDRCQLVSLVAYKICVPTRWVTYLRSWLLILNCSRPINLYAIWASSTVLVFYYNLGVPTDLMPCFFCPQEY